MAKQPLEFPDEVRTLEGNKEKPSYTGKRARVDFAIPARTGPAIEPAPFGVALTPVDGVVSLESPPKAARLQSVPMPTRRSTVDDDDFDSFPTVGAGADDPVEEISTGSASEASAPKPEERPEPEQLTEDVAMPAAEDAAAGQATADVAEVITAPTVVADTDRSRQPSSRMSLPSPTMTVWTASPGSLKMGLSRPSCSRCLRKWGSSIASDPSWETAATLAMRAPVAESRRVAWHGQVFLLTQLTDTASWGTTVSQLLPPSSIYRQGSMGKTAILKKPASSKLVKKPASSKLLKKPASSKIMKKPVAVKKPAAIFFMPVRPKKDRALMVKR
eukprot:6481978-Amphidinium_carterae.1